MKNAYLYIFNSSEFNQQEVVDYLDGVDGIDSWFYSIPSSIFIIGSVSAKNLSRLLSERFGQHRHFITIIPRKSRAGWLPKDHWALFPKEE
ncbi:MAG: hypothetical protein V4672_01725 [Verrucomicrobiota bacterium]